MIPAALFALAVAGTSAPGAPDCGKIAGAETVIAAGSTVMLGEPHGTVEGPQFLADMTCLAARRGLKVAVLLEISRSENVRFERYLSSSGSAADRAALTAGEHWHQEFPDGRSSRSVVDMLESMRKLRRAGAEVVVRGLMGSSSAQDGDAAMAAEFLAARRSYLDRFVLVFAGGNHVRTRPGEDSVNVKWMGQHIREAGVAPLLSLAMISKPGRFYSPTAPGFVQAWPGRAEYGNDRFVRLGNWLPGHDGVFNVVTTTPSFPFSKRWRGAKHQ